MPRAGVDPQDYIETLFTPYDNGIDAYLKFLTRLRGLSTWQRTR
jgi:hypothetical protein